ncbi:hypothetical protein [Paraburkholderia sp. BR14374]|uniref:hypothetical protein n=1 Tax=Paraburkholderia sp. BR14374 TaxID=3237007 RepID=UPI0034CF2AEA
MKVKSWLVVAAAAAALTDFTAAYPEEALSGTTLSGTPMVVIRLNATQSNRGKIAVATLLPGVPDCCGSPRTELRVWISGVPNPTTLPPRVFTYIYPGQCGSLGPQPAYDLNRRRVILGNGLPGSIMWISRRVEAPINGLTSSNYALVLRTSPADGNVDIFCGNLKGNPSIETPPANPS